MRGRRSRLGRRLGAVVAVPVAVLGLLAVAGRLGRALDPAAATADVGATVTSPVTAADLSAAPQQPQGFAGPERPEDAPLPEAQAPRSWRAAGRWWAVLNRAEDGALTIWGLEGPGGPWVDTGVVVDGRRFARPAVAWNGTVLVVASSGTRDYASHALQTSRFTWDGPSGRWLPAPDFPVAVADRPLPATRLALLPDGTEWMVHQEGDGLVASRSSPSGLDHGAFGPLGEGVGDHDVGGFDLTAAGGVPQIAWTSRTTDVLHVATWTGSRWRAHRHPVYGVAGAASVSVAPVGPSRPGALLVLTDTSLGERGSNDHDGALVLSVVDGPEVRTSVVSRLVDGLDDASLVVQPDDDLVRVVALGSSPPSSDPDRGTVAVVEKTASLTDLAFAPGRGRPLLSVDAPSGLAPPVLPAGTIDASSGMLVMVTGADLAGWRTAVVDGEDGAGGAVVAVTGPVSVLHDTFDALALGGPAPAAWHPGGSRPLEAEVVDAPGTGRALLLTNRGGAAASLACRGVPSGTRGVTVRADVVASGAVASDARLLSVRGPEGTLASVRLSRKGEAGWSSGDGRVAAGFVPLGTPLRVTVAIDAGASVASVRVETASWVVAEQRDVPLLAGAAGGVDEVCLGPGSGDPEASLLVTDLLVRQR